MLLIDEESLSYIITSFFPMNEELSCSKNISKSIIMTIVQTILFVAILSSMYNNDNSVTVAQINDNGTTAIDSSISNQVNTSADNNANLNTGNEDFNIEGTITSIVTGSDIQGDEMTTSNQSLTSTPNSNIPLQTDILGGKWRIDIVKGNVEYFKTNITMVTSSGTDMHNHLIEFKPGDTGTTLLSNNTAIVSPNTTTVVEIAALNSSVDNNITSISRSADNSIMFSGISDIITNGVVEWRDVPTSVSILNNNVLKIELDPKIVSNHFSDTPIYGLVNSIEPIKVIQNGTDVNDAVS
jgi:hypothetical protein